MKAVFLDAGTVSSGDLDFARLRAALPGITLLDDTPVARIPDVVADAEVVLANKLPISGELMSANASLRLVLLAATGTNNVNLDAARARGIAVYNIRDYCTPSVVQHVLGTVLTLTHHLRDYSRLAVDGSWGASRGFTMLAHPIRELAGRTLGVVGWGALGSAVARAFESALGMHVLVANRVGGERVTGRVDLHELLPQVDVLTLHCPLSEATRGMIGTRELALMKRDAVLVNTARGALIDLPALADALRARRLGGAAIDVLPQEPPIDGSPLFADDLPNLIVTPHIAWAAREARQRAIEQMAENVLEFQRGGKHRRVA